MQIKPAICYQALRLIVLYSDPEIAVFVCGNLFTGVSEFLDIVTDGTVGNRKQRAQLP